MLFRSAWAPCPPAGRAGSFRFRSALPPLILQQTRFQRRVADAATALQEWALNPWRRLSLLLIVLLVGMVLGGSLGSITGALAYFDPLSALVCVLGLEAAVRLRPRLLRSPGPRLGLQLLDMARLGILYGLLLDGFKLL
mgnify:CR=1 FL=1